jgi:hypothetical protein
MLPSAKTSAIKLRGIEAAFVYIKRDALKPSLFGSSKPRVCVSEYVGQAIPIRLEQQYQAGHLSRYGCQHPMADPVSIKPAKQPHLKLAKCLAQNLLCASSKAFVQSSIKAAGVMRWCGAASLAKCEGICFSKYRYR